MFNGKINILLKRETIKINFNSENSVNTGDKMSLELRAKDVNKKFNMKILNKDFKDKLLKGEEIKECKIRPDLTDIEITSFKVNNNDDFDLRGKRFLVFSVIHCMVNVLSSDSIEFSYKDTRYSYDIDKKLLIYYKRLRIEALKGLLYENSSFELWGDEYNFIEDFKNLAIEIIHDWINLCSDNHDLKTSDFFKLDSEIKTVKLENEEINIEFPFNRETGMNVLTFNLKCEGNLGDLRIKGYETSHVIRSINKISTFLTNRIFEWYLNIYDFNRLNCLRKVMDSKNYNSIDLKHKTKGIKRKIKNFGAIIIFIFICITEVLFYSKSDLIKNEKILSLLTKSEGYIFVFFIVLIISGGLWILNKANLSWKNFINISEFKRHNLLVPRLIATVMIGYAPIVFTGDFIDFIMVSEYGIVFVIILTALIISFLYIYIEITNALENNVNSNEIWERIFDLFNRALVYSAVMGILLIFVFAKMYNDAVTPENIKYIREGLSIFSLTGGEMYLKLFIVFVPIALVLGILLQVLWEDKSITHPL